MKGAAFSLVNDVSTKENLFPQIHCRKMCYWELRQKFYPHNLWQYWGFDRHRHLSEDKMPDPYAPLEDSAKNGLLFCYQKARLQSSGDFGGDDAHLDADDLRDGDEPAHCWCPTEPT